MGVSDEDSFSYVLLHYSYISGVVSLYRGWCTVAVGFSKGKAGIMAAIIITFLIFIILYFMLFLILIEKIPVGRYG